MLVFILINYPNSEYTPEANQMISELQEKLEKKDFEITQYYTIRDYKASIKSNENFIASFRDGTKFREESLYTKFLSLYQIGINSIYSKKEERLKEL